MAYIINWRDIQPKISHLSAVHWGGLRKIDSEIKQDSDHRNRLKTLDGFARHALQGRKTSDFHKHDTLEQVYYILSGNGEVLCDDQRHSVREGDAVYLPAGLHHQMFNETNNDWLIHHVISQTVDGPGGEFAIRNWRNVEPITDGTGSVAWLQLGTEGANCEVDALRSLNAISREAVQPLGKVQNRYRNTEEILYVIDGAGFLVDDSGEQQLIEGDMIHVPPHHGCDIVNSGEGWLIYLVISGKERN